MECEPRSACGSRAKGGCHGGRCRQEARQDGLNFHLAWPFLRKQTSRPLVSMDRAMVEAAKTGAALEIAGRAEYFRPPPSPRVWRTGVASAADRDIPPAHAMADADQRGVCEVLPEKLHHRVLARDI